MPIDPHPNFKCPRNTVTANRRWWIRLLLVSLMLPWGQLAAGDAKPATSKAEAAAAPVKVAVPEAAAEEEKPVKPPMTAEKRRLVAVASLMMGGVVASLLCLFMWMLWWSRRTRKLLREPLPVAGRGDELWYLKAKQDVLKAAERLAEKKKTPPPQSRPES
jgi:hypothetical protein